MSPICSAISNRPWAKFREQTQNHPKTRDFGRFCVCSRRSAANPYEWYGSALTNVTLTVLPLGTV